MKKLSIHSLAVGLLLATASGTALANTKTVVLVHGAFADGSSWNRVIDQLQRQHTEVIAVQLPLTSLKEDVAATQRAIARTPASPRRIWRGAIPPRRAAQVSLKPPTVFSICRANRYARTLRQTLKRLSRTR